MTSFSTNTGNEIEKFSPPKNPIYRVEYVRSTAIVRDERDELILSTKQFSVVGELLPLNNKDEKMISKFDEYKKKNPDLKGWLDELHSWDLDDYMNEINCEGYIHLKLFKHIQRIFEAGDEKNAFRKQGFDRTFYETKRCHHYLFTKLERIA